MLRDPTAPRALIVAIVLAAAGAIPAGATVRGTADFEPIEAFRTNEPVMALARAVGRLRVVGDDATLWTCTAFLIADNVALTANQCGGGLRAGAKADSLTLEMGYFAQDPDPPGRVYKASLISEDRSGFALLKVEGLPGREWGKLRLTRQLPAPGAPLLVIQHPAGEPLQLVRRDCQVISLEEELLRHTCDTLGGSSGAPVFDVATGSVVGIHSLGSAPDQSTGNGAVRSDVVLQRSELASAATMVESLASEEKPLADLGSVVPSAPERSVVPSAPERGARPVGVKDPQGRRVVEYAGSYALLIGVSEYTNGWGRLANVPKDITAVKQVLEGLGFATTVLSDPTRAELQDALDKLVFGDGLGRDNRILVYYAGHGESLKLGDGRVVGYLVPRDAPLPDADRNEFLRRALSMSQFERYAKDIQSRHALFVFDSCFAGTIFSALRARPPVIDRKIAEPVRQFITSGNEEQKVPDVSIFRGEFIRGLSGEADRDGDGYITGSELGIYLESQVTNLSRGTQTPVYGKLIDPVLGRGDFVFQRKR